MGVKGLKRYLDSEANSKLHVTEPIPNGSRLHVDGNGWMFHLMKTPEGLAIPRQYGGSYIEYDSLLRKTYHALLDLGISLTFYFDGADSHMKSTTKKERRLQRGESWMAVYNATVSRNPKPDQTTLDLPPFTKQQFLSTLESLGATMVHCEFEADQDMVLACRKANEKSKQSQSHYCFGDDTDYLIMKDCPYIVFGTLIHKRTSASSRPIGTAVVWRRSRLAKSLGFADEQQLVEWAILIGNDYTKHFTKSSFIGYSNLKNGQNEFSSLEIMRKFIASQKPPYRLSSADAELELAINYSRAVYNLLDLTSYEKLGDLHKSGGRFDADDENSDGYSLSSIEKSSLNSWRRTGRRTSKRSDSVGLHVISFLRPYLNDNKVSEMERKQFEGITGAHLDAFALMLKNINEAIGQIHDTEVDTVMSKLTSNLANTDFFGDGSRKTVPAGMQKNSAPSAATSNEKIEDYLCPKWENVRAARTYQLLCARFFEKKGKEVNMSDRCTSQPMHLYDGKMFHRAMEAISVKNGQDAKRVAAGDVMDTPGPRSDPQVQRPPLAAMNGSNGHTIQSDNDAHNSRPTNARNGNGNRTKKAAPQSYAKPLTKQQQKDENTITHYSQAMSFDLRRLQTLNNGKLMILIQQINDMKREIREEEQHYTAQLRANNNHCTGEVLELRERKKENMEAYREALNFRTTLREMLDSRVEDSEEEYAEEEEEESVEYIEVLTAKTREAKMITNYLEVLNFGLKPLQYLTEEHLKALIDQVPNLLPAVINSEYAYVDALHKNNCVRSKRALKLLANKKLIDEAYRITKRTLEKLKKVLHNRIAYGAPRSRMIPVPVDNNASQAYHQNGDNVRAVNNRAEAPPRPAQAQHSTPFPKTSTHNSPKPAVQSALPIDGYRDEILHRIASDRVTIIQGETGCGKSSRLPVMLLEDAASRGMPCRIMVSQPRRIAASSLMRRLRPTLGMKVGLRMGDDIKDESSETVIHFVTCGYILKLMAHHPGFFSEHTHIIVDEVHERSIEGDMLCMMTRKLLTDYPNIRLVLMSATMETDLLKDYYADIMYPRELVSTFVGVRCFPLKYYYLEDILKDAKAKRLPNVYQEKIRSLIESTKMCRGHQEDDIPMTMIGAQEDLVMTLVKELATPGSAILIFVSGLSDIISLSEKLERISKFQLCYIHSEVPYEDQVKAFEPTLKGKIKIIIANNTAVSSVTFPDVDIVLCLGTHKSLQYVPRTHTTLLCNTWISKSTATQRAGRTGRVRPGTVYRLYSEKLSNKFDAHDPSEIFRRPLQDVILDVWCMTEDSHDFQGIIPTLQDLPEAPYEENIDFSLQTLHKYGMTTDDKGQGSMTSLGRFSGAMPLDLRLGMLIHYGIALGIGAESIVFASALSQRASLFKKTSFLMRNHPTHFNDVIRKCFLGSVRLDNETYSEPVLHLTAYKKWISLPVKLREKWAKSLGIRVENMTKFVANVGELIKKVNMFLGRKDGKYESDAEITKRGGQSKHSLDVTALNISHDITPRELNHFRLILTWVSADNILRQADRPKEAEDTANTVEIKKSLLGVEAMRDLFPTCEMLSIEDDNHWKIGNLKIPLNIHYEGTSVYEAIMDDYGCAGLLLLELIDSVTDSAYKIDNIQCNVLGPSIVWLVREPCLFADESESYLMSQLGYTTLVTIAFSESLPQNVTSQIKNLFNHRLDEPSVLDTRQSVKDCRVKKGISGPYRRHDGYVAFQASNVSQMELDALAMVHLLKTPVVSVVTPLKGKAKLRATNHRPTQESLRRIFFHGEEAGDKRTISGESNVKQVIRFNQTNMSNSDTWKNADMVSSDEVKDPSLKVVKKIEDCDIGLQLMNSYLTMDTKSRQLVLRIAKAPQSNTAYNAYDEFVENADKITVLRGSLTNWTNIGQVINHAVGGVKAVMPRHSVSATTMHQGVETLYGVAFTSLITRSHKLYSIVDGVTLLPPGGLWISLALSCVGVDPHCITSFEKSKFTELDKLARLEKEMTKAKEKDNKKDKNGKVPVVNFNIDKYDFTSCKTIQKYLGALGVESLKRDDNLIRAVDYVFAAWFNE